MSADLQRGDGSIFGHTFRVRLEQIRERTGDLPASLLADGGHLDFASIEAATALGVVPVISPRTEKTLDNHMTADSLTAWRERIPTPRLSAAASTLTKRAA